jgi:hypothetical protein
MSHEFNPHVRVQLAHNQTMRQLHARAQDRLDRLRDDSVARTNAQVAMVQVGGTMRNALAGQLAAETMPRARKQLRFASDFSILKAPQAGRKAGH